MAKNAAATHGVIPSQIAKADQRHQAPGRSQQRRPVAHRLGRVVQLAAPPERLAEYLPQVVPGDPEHEDRDPDVGPRGLLLDVRELRAAGVRGPVRRLPPSAPSSRSRRTSSRRAGPGEAGIRCPTTNGRNWTGMEPIALQGRSTMKFWRLISRVGTCGTAG